MVSYDVLIGMEWLEKHHVTLNCLETTFTCIDDLGNPYLVKGIPRKDYVRQIYALQLKRSVRRGCKIYLVSIQDCNKETCHKLDDCPILPNIRDVFQII